VRRDAPCAAILDLVSARHAIVLPGVILVAAFGAAVADAGSRLAVRESTPIPGVIRQKTELTVTGRVTGAPRRTRVALELQRLGTKTWSIAAKATDGRRGAFTIRWRVPASYDPGPVSIRFAALTRTATVLASTKPVQSAIGPAYVACSPPVPPMVEIPADDGWIVGGAYGIGGAFPGIDACIQQQYVVTATNSAGQTAATETVPGGHSYTLAPLPAGSYTLQAGACRGTATVSAGNQTTANADCDYP
jgi:hypothetical protein